MSTTKATRFDFTVSDAKGQAVCHTGEYWDGVGVACTLPDGPDRIKVENAVRFLHAEPIAVSVNLDNGWTVERLARPAVTSERGTMGAVDETKYQAFVTKTTRANSKAGQTPADAARNAESICSMYRHQFRAGQKVA